MNDKSDIDNKRRLFLGGMAALAGVPLLNTIFAAQAEAAGLPHLTESDPTAEALHYHQDATKAPRKSKPDMPADKQFCHNCMFIKSNKGTWRPCQIFPGKLVNANGWCASWTHKPA
ncbi:MAG: high-potential iron-sulfur protein [Gammaproteobacteria bacterium]|jgi:hypothetical protein